MKSEELLVDRRELEDFIDGIEGLKPFNACIKKRWLQMVMWWHNRSVQARRWYFLLRAIVVTGGVLIPVLSVLNMFNTFAPYLPVVIAFVGAVVAGSAAWETVTNYGEIWREKRRAAELLKSEGWQFFQLCGKYQRHETHDAAFPDFAAKVEKMIAKEVGEYLAPFEPPPDQPKEPAP